MDSIPYIAHESMMARMERTIKRLWITIMLLVVLIVGILCFFFYYESQFVDEVTTETYESNSDGGNAIINRDGEFNYNVED